MQAPTDAQGGGLTITKAGCASRNAIAAGSAPFLALVTLSTASVVDGTIAAFTAGAFTAGTAVTATLSTAFVDASKYVAWKVMGTVVNADQIYLSAWYEYIMGY
jgi:hypothetical protein